MEISLNIAEIMTQAGSIFGSFAPIVVLVVGIFLGFRVVRFIIGLFG